jgi:putative tricarboxylic transport membrane protein
MESETPREPNHRGYEMAIGIAVAAIGVVFLILATNIELAREGLPFGPRWWPTALAVAMILIGAILVIQALVTRTSSGEPRITRSGGVALVATLSLIIGYGFAWQYLDFRAVTPVLLLGLTFVFGGRGIKALVVFPVVTTLLLWSIFGLLLRVPL